MNKSSRISTCLALGVASLLGSVLLPQEASCRLTAEAELGYVNMDAKDNTRHVSAHSLTQHYSILYNKSGKFANGRLGRYDVALGYEWLTYDTGISSSSAQPVNLSANSGHIYFLGDVLIDPKEIPLRLNLYSRDMSRSAFSTDGSIGSLSFLDSGVNSVNNNSPSTGIVRGYNSSIITGIDNGKHIESGATLVMGVKNGMTNGYNELLRHFPMLMVDYRDQLNVDKNRLFPVDNRLTRLAFVSLNKKDNWFHYRYVTYDDNIDRNNSYRETQIQLGTVDHTLQRRWIDFTNWLNVSADGQLTKRVNARVAENYDEFSLNLFGTARRQSWEARTFNNFTRLNETNLNRITYKTSVPVYANGIISPTADWSAYTRYNDNKTTEGESFTTVAGGYTVNAFRKSPFTLSQGLSVEHVTTSRGSENLITGGNISTSSTSLFSRDLSLKAAYRISNTRYNNSNNTTSFTEQTISGNVGYNVTRTLRIMADQTNRFTTGTSENIASSIAGATISSSQYISPRVNAQAGGGGSSYQSISGLSVSWTPKPRLNFGVSATEDIYVPASGERSIVTTADATASYTDGKLRLSSKNKYVSGNANNGDLANQLSSTNTAEYIFNRNLDGRVELTYLKTLGSPSQPDMINAEQYLNYYYFKTNGVTRKLFEINESFSSVGGGAASDIKTIMFSSAQQPSNAQQRTNTLLLGAKYYPLRQMMLAGGARYSFVNRYENYAVTYYGSLSLRFRLLEASLDYSYGKTKTDDRVEKRISANVKKRF